MNIDADLNVWDEDENRWENVKNDAFAEISEKNAKIMTCGIWGNLLITVGVSAFLCFVA